ncbi:MAG: NAD(P)/FAD-dependent oxidoreductase [Xanthobacteraceae bacterium]|nr:NAD(P)/FAD-dependent oxidoreductase [Xanthobacteraceae bacterium]
MQHRAADILVAGGGPAGATIARLLALRGRQVVLVDPGTRRTERLEIIAPAACRVAEAVGIAHLLYDASLSWPCSGIRRRWGTAEIELDDFLRRPGGKGYVIDRAPFDDALRAMAMDVAVERIAGRVVAARREGGAVVVGVQSGAQRISIAAALVIDATGRPSAVARRMGARRLPSERLVAERQPVDVLRAPDRETPWLDVDGAHNAWSYQVSGPNGRCEAWTVYRPGDRPGRPQSCADASSSLLSRAAGDGWIAIGDAAASFDPVTSQGLVNALSTALVAAGAILSSDGLDDNARGIYADAVAATFHHAEAGRARVYAGLAPPR